jgi:hypothetical protein
MRIRSLVAAARGPHRRTAFFCPEVRPLAAAQPIGARDDQAPWCGTSPVGSALAQKNAVPSQTPPGSLTKLRERREMGCQ